jgi:NAD(P)-dependent dehydrogenase (short-subunit alcohol dehydrogenase family)
MQKKSVVVIGANRGIGLAMVNVFSEKGYEVHAVCRKSSVALNALSVNVIEQVDVATDEGLVALKGALNNTNIDLLVCNAGILRDESLADFNLDTIREQFEVNTLAPLRVVETLQAQLSNGGKVAMITSRMGSIADNGSGGRYGYRMSKAALNAGSMSLSKDLAPRNIAVGIYHPGYVQTDMVNGSGDISADEAASKLIALMENLTLAESGVFKHSNGQTLPW